MCAGLWTAAALTGCSEAPDDLDARTVAELGSQVGDAMGPKRSGRYRWAFTDAECGCDGLLTGGQWTLCGTLLTGGAPGPWTSDLDVWVADGQIELGLELATTPPMVGPFDDDGTAQAGSVARVDSLLTSGDITTRFDGEFSYAGDPETGAGSVLVEGELRQRLVGDATLGDISESIDCEERLVVSGLILVER